MKLKAKFYDPAKTIGMTRIFHWLSINNRKIWKTAINKNLADFAENLLFVEGRLEHFKFVYLRAVTIPWKIKANQLLLPLIAIWHLHAS